MSFYNVPMVDYAEKPAGTPGWWNAPVPGWGMNVFRAGPERVGIGRLGDYYEPGQIPEMQAVLPRYQMVLEGMGATPEESYRETTWGHVALAASGGILLGVIFGFAWWKGPKR
jgi:hypothetical protein